MSTLSGKRILLCIGGGIAAYKSAILCSRLAQAGCSVRVAMTDSALQFVGEATFAALSGHGVVTQLFDPRFPTGSHIEIVEGIDLMLIAPTTANLIADFASGRAGDLVTTCYLQNQSPVLLAPAASAPMWEKPSVQRNVEILRGDGVHFVGPDSGWLACRKLGVGRMSEPETILAAAESIFDASHRI